MIDSSSIVKDAEITKAYINEFLKANKIHMPKQYQEVFDHHLKVMIYRLQHEERIDMNEEGVVEQVPMDCMQLSEQMLKPLFEKYSIERNDLEITLIAIYLNLAKEEKENE